MDEIDSLQSFASKYRDLLLQNLEMISSEELEESRKFICLSFMEGDGYVQCRFFEKERMFLCEAESGFYRKIFDERDRFQLNDKQLRAVKELGFSEGTQENFRKKVRFKDSNDYLIVADLMLATLYNVYGARFYSTLEWDAPIEE